jgi:GT2 family glycosyltransferase
VIGRNEGERLRRCLAALGDRRAATAYVDSGSTDGSVDVARSLGVTVVALDGAAPFTAARARNAGFARLRELVPDATYVQFVDGDCELAPGWLEAAEEAIEALPVAGVVFGRLRERHPEASVYNRLCDLEWDAAPVGAARACGGNALVRVAAFASVGGFDSGVVAAEDDEFCLRLRRAGWEVYRIAADMGRHDAAMTHLGQWWTRAVRSGYAYAQGADLHGHGPERHFVRERGRVLLWGAAAPALALALAWPTGGWSLLAFLLYPLQWVKVLWQTHRRGVPAGPAAAYAAACVVSKVPQAVGVLRYALERRRRRPVRLIEYK